MMINLPHIILLLLLVLNFQQTFSGSIEATNLSPNLFLTPNQTQFVPLSVYVNGKNLRCGTNDTLIEVIPRKIQLNSSNTSLPENIINIDILRNNIQIWKNFGEVLTQKSDSTYQITQGQFIGYDQLPTFKDPIDLNLTNQVCLSVTMLTYQYSLINCQGQQDNSTKDFFYIFDGTKVIDNYTYEVNFPTNKTKIRSLTDYSRRQFIIKLDQDNQGMTIYERINTQIYYVRKILATDFNLKELMIIDFDVVSWIIVLIDQSNSQLISFTIVNSQIKYIEFKKLTSNAQKIARTPQGTVMVSIDSNLIQFQINPFLQIGMYQLPSEGIESIQVNIYLVMVTTSIGNMLIYQRNKPQLQDLLYTENIPNSFYLLSPYYNTYTLFLNNSMTQVRIDNGHLKINSSSLPINTISYVSLNCTANDMNIPQRIFMINIVPNNNETIIKKKLSNSFSLKSIDKIDINFNDYYAGPFLQYKVSSQSKDLNLNLNYISNYSIKGIQYNPYLESISGIDSNTYIYIGAYSDNKNTKLIYYNCQIYKTQIICKQFAVLQQINYTLQVIVSRYTRNNALIIGYCSSKIFGTFKFENINDPYGTKSGIGVLNNQDCSDIIINDLYVFKVAKQLNMIRVLTSRIEDTHSSGVIFDIKSNNINMNGKQQQEFSPRGIVISEENSNIIYVKQPMKIMKLAIIINNNTVIQVFDILNELIPQNQWDFIVGMHSMLIVRKSNITEYSLDSLDMIQLRYSTFQNYSSVTYNPSFDGAYIEDSQGNTFTYLLNKPQVEYKSINLKSPNNNNQNSLKSRHWQVFSNIAFYQNKQPILTLESNIEQNKFKYNRIIDLNIFNPQSNKTLNIQANVAIINYPKLIISTQIVSPNLSLPQNYHSIQSIPMNRFYQGCIVDYNITFSQFKNQAKLLKPLSLMKSIQISSSTIDMIQIDSYTVILTLDTIILIDQQLIQKIQLPNNYSCLKMGYNQKVGLFIFCYNGDRQVLVFYQFREKWINSYIFTIENTTISFINDITVYSDAQTIIFINDYGVKDTSFADVKIFKFTYKMYIKTLQYIDVWTSQNFNYNDTMMSINDIVLENGYILVTLKNLGIGYAKIDQSSLEFVYANYLNFSSLDQIQQNIVYNAIYNQIKVLQMNGNKITFLITSINSLQLVLSMNINDNDQQWTFTAINEKYNRYYEQDMLNWQYINSNFLMLIYYNITNSQYTLGMYPRSKNATNIQCFQQAIQFKPSSSEYGIKRVAVVSNNTLYVSLLDNNYQFKIYLYHINLQFSISFNYDSTDSLNKKIQIMAMNQYSSAIHEIPVNFYQNDDGLKWYIILIIVASGLIAVGIAICIFLKIRSNRKKNKLSLLSETDKVV